MQILDPLKRLDEHILSSYSVLRWVMCGFGFALPLLLVIGGRLGLWWLGESLPIQNSLSAYYHAQADHQELNMCLDHAGDYRDLFVGLLAGISLCLIIYTGFGKLENWLLNGAGICLAGVAFFPTGWPDASLYEYCQKIPGFKPFLGSHFLGLPVPVHLVSAIGFFLLITLVNVLTAMNSVDVIADHDIKRFWTRVFRFARWLMPISIGSVMAVHLFTGTRLIGDRFVLLLEWAGIWAFSLYWLLKSLEILGSRVDVDAINNKIEWGAPSRARTENTTLSPRQRGLEYK